MWYMCWRNFRNFPWWVKDVKSRSKIALYSKEHHFEIWFPKKRTITFFWCKFLSKLHKKDPILHVATTFSLKQGETRTSHGPIPHPLFILLLLKKLKFIQLHEAVKDYIDILIVQNALNGKDPGPVIVLLITEFPAYRISVLNIDRWLCIKALTAILEADINVCVWSKRRQNKWKIKK